MNRRVVISLLLPLFALAALTASAQAARAPQPGTASATISKNGDCTVTVTYAWSGVKGSDLTAQVGIHWPGPGGTTFWVYERVDNLTGSGTVSRTFDVTGYGSNVFDGWGSLQYTNGKAVRGSMVDSPTGVAESC